MSRYAWALDMSQRGPAYSSNVPCPARYKRTSRITCKACPRLRKQRAVIQRRPAGREVGLLAGAELAVPRGGVPGRDGASRDHRRRGGQDLVRGPGCTIILFLERAPAAGGTPPCCAGARRASRAARIDPAANVKQELSVEAGNVLTDLRRVPLAPPGDRNAGLEAVGPRPVLADDAGVPIVLGKILVGYL